ncbi:hypothetical protein N7491_008023 [Penicillium cf. griseofulvum]|uniref:protein S-acyltransferase n=1 Tax=Penicillium cf. griseofulvum TaxID=2972120 RepID=A0A9W9J653_9EURO|nr:hypothetical protein N7472_008950 [Penicillium cf. griseofulvum]KAJ5427581.1 hypothetical protein N7491_008023 [Penicillium cf. griseofulvum]KAJ5431778.1 hypothetical protein N7445_008276 [Penicillium cf. griseofulvum]
MSFHRPLTEAVIDGDEDFVRRWLPKTRNLHRTRALAFAVSQENRRMAETLLRGGAPPQFSPSDELPAAVAYDPYGEGNNEPWVQPLVFAVQRGNLELVKLLLEYGADINVKSERPYDVAKFYSPLYLAVEESDEAMVNLLLDRGADPEITNEFGEPPLTYAVYREHGAIIRSLLAHGANPYGAVDRGGRKLLSFWQMKQSTFLQLQEAEIEWSKQHPC